MVEPKGFAIFSWNSEVVVAPTTMMHVRPVSDETFAAVKAGLPLDVAAECDDACIRRFIRASNGSAATVRAGAPRTIQNAHHPS